MKADPRLIPPQPPSQLVDTDTADMTAALASSPARPLFTPLAGRVLAVDVTCVVVAAILVAGTIGGLSWLGVAVLVPMWFVGLHRLGGYDDRALLEDPLRGWTLYAAVGRVALVLAVIPLLFPGFRAAAYIALLVVALVTTSLGRDLFARWLRSCQADGRYLVPVMLRGPAEDVKALLASFGRDAAQPFSVVGVQRTSGSMTSDLSMPTQDDLVDVADRCGAAAVMLVGAQSDSPEQLRRMLWRLESAGIQVLWVPLPSSVAVPKAREIGHTGVPALAFEDRDLAPETSVRKVFLDWTLASIACVVLAPFVLLTAIAIKLDSPGPVLFRQTRVGRGGARFTMYKFRTMRVGAESELDDLADRNVHEGGTLFKIPDDPRVTRVGKVLRKVSLDELPQLLNVLLGDMSLVGPRPPLPNEVENYPADLHRRFLVRPGLTGLWQVSGRSDLDPIESARLDAYYVEHWTPMMDARILAKTVRVVVAGDGAY